MRTRHFVLAIALSLSAGCHHGRPSSDTRPTEDVFRGPFVGYVRELRGNYLLLDEDTQTRAPRRGEIFVTDNTEIVTRNGNMLMPVSWLKRGMRVTVWFHGVVNATATIVSASADRMVVDF